ncbi:unnamed protein product [Psylliodes chrysocephalus]|uniref:Amino acid transporter transmembrane domain-containing protein n=1 Tax=Psylliodes chrysocephalus TaxID=3402493 RepID=A0A9P0CJ16_9CUCU|nr:unnamed protein product [Psylliodes chrysocephala]
MASKKWDDDYDPHKERKNENGLTHSEGITNVIKGCLGTGLLALPEAFHYAGTINGIVMFIIISIFGTYCFHLMLYSTYLLCKIKKVGFLSYANAMEAAFEVGPNFFKKMVPCSAVMVHIVMMLYQTGTMCVYILFMGYNIKMVCDQYFPEKHLLLYILYTFPASLLLTFIPNMKWFTPLAIFANIVSFVTFAVIFWYVTRDLPPFSSEPYVGHLKDFPLFFGTSLFALLSVPIILSVENNMADPAYFVAPVGALNIGFGTVTVLYAIVGILGCWRYGEKIHSSITLNFPANDVLSQTIRSLYSVAIWITYGFNGVVPRDVVWINYIAPRLKEDISAVKKWTIDYTLRFIIVIITYIISMGVPLLGPVLSMTGGVCLSLLGILFPAFMEICALWPDNFGKRKWILWKDFLICLIGLVGLAVSMYASIRDIIEELSQNPSLHIGDIILETLEDPFLLKEKKLEEA